MYELVGKKTFECVPLSHGKFNTGRGFVDYEFLHTKFNLTTMQRALSALPQKLSRRFAFVSFGGDIKPSVLGNPLKTSLSAIGSFLVSWVIDPQ